VAGGHSRVRLGAGFHPVRGGHVHGEPAAPDAEVRRARFRREMAALLGRARAAGAIRRDVTIGDVLLIFAANAGVTAAGQPAQRVERSRRLADLALTGLGV
jgi:hypothetical protein